MTSEATYLLAIYLALLAITVASLAWLHVVVRSMQSAKTPVVEEEFQPSPQEA